MDRRGRLSWLYGPETRSDGLTVRMRAVEVDVEDLADAGRAALRGLDSGREPAANPGDVTFTIGYGRTVKEHELVSLSAPDRNRLVVEAMRAQSDGTVDGARFSVSESSWMPYGMSAYTQGAIDGGIRSLLEAGEPRADWRRLRITGPAAALLVATGLFVWSAWTVVLPPPLWLLLGVLVAGFDVAAIVVFRRWQAENLRLVTPSIVRAESRALTYARRADHKRDRRVAFLSVLATAGAALIVGAVWWLLTGSPSGSPGVSPTP